MSAFVLNLKLAILYSSSHKLRTFLTMLGLIIGISSLVLIVSLGESAQKSMVHQLQTLGTNLIVVLPGGSEEGKPPLAVFSTQEITTLKEEDADVLAKVSNVVGLTPYVKGSAEINYLGKTKAILFNGVKASFLSVENAKVEKGRFFTSQEEKKMSRVVVLGYKIAKDVFGEADPIGKRVKIKNQNYLIIGVMAKRGKIFTIDYDNQVYFPFKTAQKLILGINHINFIRAKISNENKIPQIAEAFKNILRRRHNIKTEKKDDFTVRTSAQMLDVFYKITNILKLFLALIASVSLVVGGIGISNVMYVIVDERVREIGLRKAVGARNFDILYQFLLESMLLSFFGGLIGIILGIFEEYLTSVFATKAGIVWPFSLSWQALVVSFFVSLFIGLIFGILPAKKASKLSPSMAMRYE